MYIVTSGLALYAFRCRPSDACSAAWCLAFTWSALSYSYQHWPKWQNEEIGHLLPISIAGVLLSWGAKGFELLACVDVDLSRAMSGSLIFSYNASDRILGIPLVMAWAVGSITGAALASFAVIPLLIFCGFDFWPYTPQVTNSEAEKQSPQVRHRH